MSNPQGKEVIAYVADWQYYDRGQLAAPWKLPESYFQKYTMLNYAFFDYLESTRDGRFRGIDDNSSPQVLHGERNWNPGPEDAEEFYLGQDGTWKSGYFKGNGIIDRAHANGCKVGLSIGGWSFSPGMPQLFDVESNRQKFAESCVEAVQKVGFDLIDIDWEYPGKGWSDPSIESPKHGTDHVPTPRDGANFVDLLRRIRVELDNAGFTDVMITSCFNINPSSCDYDIAGINQYLDYFNLMGYDMAGAFSAKSNHHTNLYDPSWADETVFSIDKGVKDYISRGVPREKINIGLASYGRTMKGATAMNQSFEGVSDLSFTNEAMPSYYNMVDKMDQWTEVWDDVAKATYWTNGTGVLTCDCVKSSYEKGKYIVNEGIAGIIEWENTTGLLSDYSLPLTDALLNGMNDNTVTYDLTVTQPDNGSITPSSKKVSEGSNITIVVTPNPGYIVDKVTVNGVDTVGNSVDITNVSSNISVSATLSVDPTPYYTVTTSGDAGVTFSPENPSVREGESVTVTVSAKEGYGLVDVLVDGVSEGVVSEVSLSNVTSDVTISATSEVVINPVDAWEPKVYATAGTLVSYQGSIYKNKWWAGSYDVPGSAQVWELVEGDIQDTVAPTIVLVGGDVVLTTGSQWAEPGYTASDNVDGDITSQVTVSGTVDTNTVGEYILTYSVSDLSGNSTTITRTVTIEQDVTAPIITLNGAIAFSLTVGSQYTEPGYSATDDVDGDISDSVIITGSVDTNTVGVYTLTYSVTDSSGNAGTSTRTVTVVEESVDTTPPVIDLNGSSVVELVVGEVYVEAGAVATDDVDGDVSNSIIVSGSVDTSVEGIYELTYTASDSSGNTSEAVRVVEVIEFSGSSCDGVSVWDPNQQWWSYTIGDLRVDDGKLYECINTAYSYHKPSGQYGVHGWLLIEVC